MTQEEIAARYLRELGYKQVSHKYRLIAKVDVTDQDLKDYFIRENFGDATSGIPSLRLKDQRDFYRRCYATSIEVPAEIMIELRNIGAVA